MEVRLGYPLQCGEDPGGKERGLVLDHGMAVLTE